MNTRILRSSSFWKNRYLPIVLQDEAAECGLACVCMIASYWGFNINLSELRRRFSVSMKGATLLGITSIAKGCGLNVRALKSEIEDLYHIKTPCILHWGFNHFVVLKKISSRDAVIHDPGFGIRTVTMQEFRRSFTGIAIELNPGEKFEIKEIIKRYKFSELVGNVTGLKRSVFQIVALGLVLQTLALIAPFYVQWIVDEALASADYDLVPILAIGFAIVAILQTAISGIRSWLSTALSTNFNFQWLGNVFGHLLQLPLSYFEKRSSGDIMSRFESVKAIQNALTTQLVEAIIDGILVITTLLMMFAYSMQLALISVLAACFYAFVKVLTYFKLRNATGEKIIYAAKQQTHFLESIRGAQSIRLHNKENIRHSTWLNMAADQFNSELKIAKIVVSQQSANDVLFGLERVLVISIAAFAVLDGRFSIGMMYAFLSYKEQFSQRIGNLVDVFFNIKMLALHSDRVADIVMTPAENEKAGWTEMEIEDTEIEFKDISFKYADEEPIILRKINLLIPAGQSIAITGVSGSGKTTLIKILLGLLDPIDGEILIGGRNIEALGIINFRRALGVVMQNDMLFAGSIAENIAFFDPEINHDRVAQCAFLASVNKEIEMMPMAYHTMVGDIGSGLSGGQIQRILLARALYNSPKILVLDEATSNLDVSNENSVNAAIRELRLTRIIIAHRPQTIAMAERVIELKNGEIISDTLNKKPQVQTLRT
ncbi:peptidase domain-containing ABC transporter [Oxalobacteraceae sp. CFBP 13730]|nr:peptidase domain-containing ABC transporter [Oxalobacteraceae sp. CFBP 13730]